MANLGFMGQFRKRSYSYHVGKKRAKVSNTMLFRGGWGNGNLTNESSLDLFFSLGGLLQSIWPVAKMRSLFAGPGASNARSTPWKPSPHARFPFVFPCNKSSFGVPSNKQMPLYHSWPCHLPFEHIFRRPGPVGHCAMYLSTCDGGGAARKAQRPSTPSLLPTREPKTEKTTGVGGRSEVK